MKEKNIIQKQLYGYLNGVIGFGVEKKGSLVNEMYEKKIIKRNLFCVQLIYFKGENPQINIGEFNSLYNQKLLHYFSQSDQKNWSLQVNKFSIFGKTIIKSSEKPANMIIALNYNKILMPELYYDRFLNLLKRNHIKQISEDKLEFECSSLNYYKMFPSIKFTSKDNQDNLVTFEITPSSYVHLFTSYFEDKEYCTLQIRKTKDTDWLVGNVFLQHQYTIFNYEKSAIGFINLISLQDSSNDSNNQPEDEKQDQSENDDEQSNKETTSNNGDFDYEKYDYENEQDQPQQEGQNEKTGKDGNNNKSSSNLVLYLVIVGLIVFGLYYYKKNYMVQQNSQSDNNIQLLPLNNNNINH